MTITTKFFHPGDSIDVVSGPSPQNAAALISGVGRATLPSFGDHNTAPSPQIPPSPACERILRAEAILDDDRAVAANTAPSGAASAPMLTGAPAELATLNRQIERATEDAASAQIPVARLQRCKADRDLALQDLHAARAAEQDVLGGWLRDGQQGPRPLPNRALIAAENRVAETSVLAEAAEKALPEATARVAEANLHLNTLRRRQADAHRNVVLQAAEEFIAGPYADALWSFRACEDQVAAIEAHYRTAGDFQTAEQIRALAQKQHRQLPPSGGGNARAGGQIVQQLLANPAGSL